MDQTEIKALSPTRCPHCEKDIVIAFKSMAPVVTATFSPADLREAKERALREIEALPVPMEQKKPALEWIRDPDVMFSPNDVDDIIQSVLNDMENDTQATTT